MRRRREEEEDREWEFCDGGRLERETNPKRKMHKSIAPCALSPRN